MSTFFSEKELGALYFMIVHVLKHIYFQSPPQMEQTERQQYEKKEKNTHTSVEAC